MHVVRSQRSVSDQDPTILMNIGCYVTMAVLNGVDSKSLSVDI